MARSLRRKTMTRFWNLVAWIFAAGLLLLFVAGAIYLSEALT